MRDRLLGRWGVGRMIWVLATVAGFLGLLFWARCGMAAPSPARAYSPELRPGEDGARVVGRVVIDH